MIWSSDGIAKNQPVFKDDIQMKFGLVTIGYEDILCDIKWCKNELNQLLIESNDDCNVVGWDNKDETWYQSPLIHCKHVNQCQCHRYKVAIPGKVANIDHHTLWTIRS